jgi:hypothetical protein
MHLTPVGLSVLGFFLISCSQAPVESQPKKPGCRCSQTQ